MYNKRIERFKRAYPEMADVEDVYILKLLGHDKKVRQKLDADLRNRLSDIEPKVKEFSYIY